MMSMRGNLLCALSLVLVACAEENTVQPPVGYSVTTDARIGDAKGVDKKLLEIEQDIPGFGGLYFDKSGDMHVLLTDSSQAENAEIRLANILPSYRDKTGHAVSGQQMVFHKSKYAFSRLWDWRVELIPRISTVLTMFDMDEVNNVISVGVRSAGDIGTVRAAALQLGIPEDAVVARVFYAPPMSTLSDSVRPLTAGIEVGAWGSCTHGPTAERSGFDGFVIPDHCTPTQWYNDGQVVTQGGETIGQEVADTNNTWVPGGSYCPSGHTCRWSDAALIAYSNGMSVAKVTVANTLSWSHDSTSNVIDGTTPRISFIGGTSITAWTGMNVHKTGRTTGTTYGDVIASCFNITTGTLQTTMCLEATDGEIKPGDSGSPVYIFDQYGNAGLVGMATHAYPLGGSRYGAIYTTLIGIRFDFAGLCFGNGSWCTT